MKWSVVFVLVCIGLVSANTTNYEGYKVYQVKPKTPYQLKQLSSFQNDPNFDFWTRLGAVNVPVSVMVAPEAQPSFSKFLLLHRFIHSILINNVQETILAENKRQRRTQRVAAGDISFDQFLRHDEINAYLTGLAKSYPDVVKTEVIGQSYENRDMILVKISSGGSSDKPAIFVDSGIHAREWISPPVALYIINQLVENPSNKALYENVDWYIIPSLNPDGYEYTHTDERLWRKTRSPGTLCYGTDGNRNFDFHWMETGASSNQCAETYAGKQAFSEKETQALRDFLLKNENIKLYLTFHSYGQYLLYPWGYTSSLPSDWNELQSLAEDVNDAISAVDGTEYTIGSSTNVLYAAAGGSDDWAKGVAGVALSYTIELPGGGSAGFNPPASRILPIVKETWEGIKVYQKYIESKFSK